MFGKFLISFCLIVVLTSGTTYAEEQWRIHARTTEEKILIEYFETIHKQSNKELVQEYFKTSAIAVSACSADAVVVATQALSETVPLVGMLRPAMGLSAIGEIIARKKLGKQGGIYDLFWWIPAAINSRQFSPSTEGGKEFIATTEMLGAPIALVGTAALDTLGNVRNKLAGEKTSWYLTENMARAFYIETQAEILGSFQAETSLCRDSLAKRNLAEIEMVLRFYRRN